MTSEAPRSVRGDLAALRIDRSTPPRPHGGRGRWIAVIAVGVVLLVASAAVVWWTYSAPITVQVAYAQSSDPGTAAGPAPTLAGSGYLVTGDKYISIGVRVAGRIDAYLVDESDRVVKGQPLVRLDDRDYQAALMRNEAKLRRAEANIGLRKKEHERLRSLRRLGVAAQADLDVKENELRVAEADAAEVRAEVTTAKIDLDDTLLRAPTDGVILAKLKEAGEIAVPGGFAGSGDLIRMANLDDLRAEVDVNETNLSRVSLGQTVEVVPDAFPDRRYAAKVVKLYPQVNRQKGTLKVEAKIDQHDSLLRPDMSVRIHFFADAEPVEAGSGSPVVLAPRAALHQEGSEAFVWIVTDGAVRRQSVKTGMDMGDRVIIDEGLLGGEMLVVGDVAGLSAGRAVVTSSE